MDNRGPTLKINQPTRLEESMTAAEFKPWWGILISYLDQDFANEQFLPGGRYETWTAASSSPRAHKGRLTELFQRVADSPEHHLSDADCTAAQVRSVAKGGTPEQKTTLRGNFSHMVRPPPAPSMGTAM